VSALPEAGPTPRDFQSMANSADPDAADLIAIPARYGSTRLPAKPLLPIADRTKTTMRASARCHRRCRG